MTAIDTSAIAMEEPVGRHVDTRVAKDKTIIGTPTLREAMIVPGALMPGSADDFVEVPILRTTVQPDAFTPRAYRVASDAFQRFGKGRGCPARLDLRDRQSDAASKAHDVPLLFKGDDFVHTDLVPAGIPAP